MAIPTFEPGNSIQFTFVSSVAPDSAPIFKVTGVADTVIASLTSIQSTTTAFYAMYTLPSSQGFYIGEWFAQKTVSGSAYNFVKKFVFRVEETNIP